MGLLAWGITSLLSCGLSCDQAFSPNAPFQPRMVIYSVLSTQSDSQFVRIYKTYNPADNNPMNNLDEQPVTDAAVTISQGDAIYVLTPIAIKRTDDSRYESDIKAYFIYPLRVQAGKVYALSVSSPTMGAATATITVPGKGTISPYETLTLENPWHRLAAENVTLNINLGPEAKAFIVRMFIDYLTTTPEGVEQKRVEVPVNIKTISVYYDLYDFIYPKITKRTTPATPNPLLNPRSQQQEHFFFRRCAYAKTIELTHSRSFDQKFLQAVFYLIQIDEPLYNLYSVANAFQDPHSVRTDKPDYTNLRGGFGLFGSISVDSIIVGLPEKIIPPGGPETQCPN